MFKFRNAVVVLLMAGAFVGCAHNQEAQPVVTAVPAVSTVSTVNGVPVESTMPMSTTTIHTAPAVVTTY
jgi:hypothetical protein